MPVCRNCHSRISKFDNDVCPVCGCKNPLEGVTSETIEITSKLDVNSPDYKDYHPKHRLTVFFLFFLIGFTGAPLFYLKKNKFALIWLISNIAFIAILGSILAFLTPLETYLGYLIVIAITYLVNLGFGLFYLIKKDLKDGRGEFLI